MPKVELDQIPEVARLNVKQVMEAERVGRREIYNRCAAGDDHELVFADKSTGQGRVFDARSLTPSGSRRLLELQLAASQNPANSTLAAPSSVAPRATAIIPAVPSPIPTAAAPANKPQSRFAFAEIPDEIAALAIPDAVKPFVWRRYGIVQSCENGTWRREGFDCKGDYVRHLARTWKDPQTGLGPSTRSIERWIGDYRREGVMGLVDRKPGPATCAASEAMDAWQRAMVEKLYLEGKSPTQCHQLMIRETEAKQKVWGTDHTYLFPSREAVRRHLREQGYLLNALAAGASVTRAAAGYIDRRFDDEAAGDTWCTDEWNVDGLLYLDWNQGVVLRPWIITLIDERTTFILDWFIAPCERKSGLTSEMFISLFESCLRKYWRPRWLLSDWGGHFQGRMGRGYAQIDREKLLGPGADILANLGVERKEPREKNPRGNRIERNAHGAYAAFAQRDLGGSWTGSDTRERERTRVDANVAFHQRYCRGYEDAKSTPLVSFNRFAREIFPRWIEEYNHRLSQANGLNGLSPASAFQKYQPGAEEVSARRPSEEELIVYFSEEIERSILEGGIVELPDGKRYSHPLLTDCKGEVRRVKRARHDHSYVVVLPDVKGEEIIIAPKRIRVGTHDPDALAESSECTARQRKVVDLYAASIRFRGEQLAAAAEASAPVAQPSFAELTQAIEIPAAEKAQKSRPEIEAEILEETREELPSLYEFTECTAEEL
jgi:transposase InsO family protein